MIYKGSNYKITEDEYDKALSRARLLLVDVLGLDDNAAEAMPALDVLDRVSEHFEWVGMWVLLCVEERRDRRLLHAWNIGRPIGSPAASTRQKA